MRSCLLLVVLVAACSSPPKKKDGERARKDEAEPEAEAKPKPKPIDPCAPSQLGLGAARQLPPWAAPTGCTAKSGANEPTAVTSEAEFAARFECPKGTTSGLDFTKQQLMVQDKMLSPAGAGTTIVDDGSKVTFIERDRSPCPGDPQPMPMGYTLGFVLPAGAERSYATRSCTLPPKC
ncbi:MAG TPA: hypothetical protein VG755_41570 [Nannocystaceae bacterium]|nr:hypothetical protein [Nannocystaceae bacterium]